jgi:predicted anti-sigma-YlaC factor YlaD
MMFDSCEQVREELSTLLDGELSGSLKSELETHLTSCAECGKEYEQLKDVNEILNKVLSMNEETPDIWLKLKDRLPSVCEVIQEDLSAYLDGELTVPAQEGVNQHLKECQTCLGQFQALTLTNQALAKGLELPTTVNVDIWSGVKERLTKDCNLIDSELSAYLDQEVVTLRHREITKHLAECETCRLEFARLSGVGDLIRDAYKPTIPDNFDLWPQIKSKLNVVQFTPKVESQQTSIKVKNRGIDRRYYLGAAVAAVLVLVFGLGGFWLNNPGQSNITPVSAESYLIDTSLLEPADRAEAVVYEE